MNIYKAIPLLLLLGCLAGKAQAQEVDQSSVILDAIVTTDSASALCNNFNTAGYEELEIKVQRITPACDTLSVTVIDKINHVAGERLVETYTRMLGKNITSKYKTSAAMDGASFAFQVIYDGEDGYKEYVKAFDNRTNKETIKFRDAADGVFQKISAEELADFTNSTELKIDQFLQTTLGYIIRKSESKTFLGFSELCPEVKKLFTFKRL